MWDVKEPKHYSKRVGREVPGVVAVLCVVNTGPMLIAVTITEMVILYKYVEITVKCWLFSQPVNCQCGMLVNPRTIWEVQIEYDIPFLLWPDMKWPQ